MVVTRKGHVFELREEIRVFLEQEHKYKDAGKNCDENFLAKLSYLTDIVGKLNELNLQLQGEKTPP